MSYTTEKLLSLADNFQEVTSDSLEKSAKKKEQAKGKKMPPWLKNKKTDSSKGSSSSKSSKDSNNAKDKSSKKLDPKAEVRNRGTVCVPAEKAKDKKDHFPINDAGQARNALARVHQFDKVPEWYNGSLSGLQALVARKVKEKYPSIDVGSKKSNKKASEYYSDILKKFGQRPEGVTQRDYRGYINRPLGQYIGEADQPGFADKTINVHDLPNAPKPSAAPQKYWGGPEMVAMVKDIQKYLNTLPRQDQVQLTVDGKIGPETQKAMNAATGKSGNPMSPENLSEFNHIPSVASWLHGKETTPTPPYVAEFGLSPREREEKYEAEATKVFGPTKASLENDFFKKLGQETEAALPEGMGKVEKQTSPGVWEETEQSKYRQEHTPIDYSLVGRPDLSNPSSWVKAPQTTSQTPQTPQTKPTGGGGKVYATGPDVFALQNWLNSRKPNSVVVDGKLGDNTVAAARAAGFTGNTPKEVLQSFMNVVVHPILPATAKSLENNFFKKLTAQKKKLTKRGQDRKTEVNRLVFEANAAITDLYTLVKTSGGLNQGILGVVGGWGKFLAEYNLYTGVFKEGITVDNVNKALNYIEKMRDVLTSPIRGVSQGVVENKAAVLLNTAETKLTQVSGLLLNNL